MNKKLTIGLSIAAIALTGAGAAFAQNAMNHDGTITRAEAQTRATQMFAKMDVNSDGKIDVADRAARMGQMFDRIDADHNGQISRDEFMAHHQPDPGGHEGMDHGGDHGGMAHGDGGPGMRHGGHGGGRHGMMGGRMMGMARMADANNDGAISQAEFTTAAMQHFDKVDANHDGSITKEERQAARQAMRAQWRARAQPAPQG